MITPFNFPLEIPAIQTLSALFMGNRPLVKVKAPRKLITKFEERCYRIAEFVHPQVDEKVQIVFEQFLRLLLHCGLPTNDVDLLWSNGPVCMEVGLSELCETKDQPKQNNEMIISGAEAGQLPHDPLYWESACR